MGFIPPEVFYFDGLSGSEITLVRENNKALITQVSRPPENWPEKKTCHYAFFKNERDNAFFRAYSTRLDVLAVLFLYFCYVGRQPGRFLKKFHRDLLT